MPLVNFYTIYTYSCFNNVNNCLESWSFKYAEIAEVCEQHRNTSKAWANENRWAYVQHTLGSIVGSGGIRVSKHDCYSLSLLCKWLLFDVII